MTMDYLAVMARAQMHLLELRVSAPGNALERVYGCVDSGADPA
jgi:hypothetical protein